MRGGAVGSAPWPQLVVVVVVTLSTPSLSSGGGGEGGRLTTRVERDLSVRNQACNMLVAVDSDTVLSGQSKDQVWATVTDYVNDLNRKYKETILKNPPNQQMYIRLEEVRILHNFLPGCNNESVVLQQFSRQTPTDTFCLAHLLTYRDFGCVVGLANVGGLCRTTGNTGFTKTQFKNKTAAVHTMWHEVGHNFGAEHDGDNTTAYRSCDPKTGSFIMGGGGDEFSYCSIQAMQHKLHEVINDPKKLGKCFKNIPEGTSVTAKISEKNFPNSNIACPVTSRPSDKECEDNPDPPEPPTPPPEPVCGDGKLDHPEECDCGPTHRECDDSCCYPGELSAEDLAMNSSALPCTRFTHFPCTNPYRSFYVFGFGLAWLAILFLFLFFAIILFIDWRFGRRYFYSHIIQPGEDIRIDVHGNSTKAVRY